MEDLYSILIIMTLIILNGTFVAAEFAIARVRKTHVDQIAEGKEENYPAGKIKTAKLLQKILLNMNDYISACQVGITIASLALGATAEAEIVRWVAPWIEELNLAIDPHSISIILAIMVVTFFHVIIGEIVPKNIAIINPETVSFQLAHFLRILFIIFKIPVLILNACSNFCLGVMGMEMNFSDSAHSEAELKMILSSSQEQGVLEEDEEELIQNVFDFNDTVARDVMVPRSDMVLLNDKLNIAEATLQVNKTTFSRFPIYREKVDNIVGYVSIKDMLKAYEKGVTDNNIKSIANDVLKVSDGMFVIDLMQLMQEKKKSITILIDEFGGVSGLLTIEDMVEEIFGEIEDEDDITKVQIRKLNNGDFIVDGLMSLKDLNEEIGSEFESEHFDTIGGFVFGLIGTEPKIGDIVENEGYKLKVEKHSNNRIKSLRISVLK